MPRLYQTALWRLQVPDAWKGEVRGEHAAFFRPDGVGLLQVHWFYTVGRPDLLACARDRSPPGTTFTKASCGRLRGIAGVLIDRSTLWRTWWLLCRGRLVYAAYQCATKNSQDECDDLEQILQSFDGSPHEVALPAGFRTAVTDIGLVITASLPGLRDVDIQLLADRNTIRCIVKRTDSHDPFEAAICIPSGYRAGDARAAYLNDELQIIIPKSAA